MVLPVIVPTPVPSHAFPVVEEVLVVQVGSTMIKSPGSWPRRSLPGWFGWLLTWVGALPRTVTVTESIDCLPLPAVMTSSPHAVTCPGAPVRVGGTVLHLLLDGAVRYVAGYGYRNRGIRPAGVMVAAAPPMVTEDNVLQVALPAVGLVHCEPKP